MVIDIDSYCYGDYISKEIYIYIKSTLYPVDPDVRDTRRSRTDRSKKLKNYRSSVQSSESDRYNELLPNLAFFRVRRLRTEIIG